VTTILVMHTFKAAQPALLYLVPCCLGASSLVALIRREFRTLWDYSEENISKIQKKKTKQKQPKPIKTSINQKSESKKNPGYKIKTSQEESKQMNKKGSLSFNSFNSLQGGFREFH